MRESSPNAHEYEYATALHWRFEVPAVRPQLRPGTDARPHMAPVARGLRRGRNLCATSDPFASGRPLRISSGLRRQDAMFKALATLGPHDSVRGAEGGMRQLMAL